MMKWVAALLFLCGSVNAQNFAIGGPFSGLNDTDSSITIGNGEAQDLLNVEVSLDGLAVKKRSGYSQVAALTVSTGSISGSIAFKDTSGNIIKLFAHDRYVSKSVNGSSFSTIIATATVGAKWSFCASDGKVYGFNDKHDRPMSYDGTSVIYYSTLPYASLCAMTVDRMLLAGTTDYPNRLYFSRSGSILDFTVDIDPEDPGFEDIGLPGEAITNIFATQAEWLVYKNNSMTSYQGSNQFDLVPSVISERVGMNEPHAIVQNEGIVYFKSSDGRIWGYTAGTLTELSSKISTFVSNITRDETRTALYSDKFQFDSGTYYKSTGSIVAGSIDPLQFSATDTLNADFNAGTLGSSITVSGDSFYLAINNPTVGGWSALSSVIGNAWKDITYGNSLFVAISEDGTNRVITSSDGITFSSASAAEANAWSGVTYSSTLGLFIAVSRDGTNRVMTSPDGSSWTARSAVAVAWEDVVCSTGICVAVGNGGSMYSTDGINWTVGTLPDVPWADITYGDGKFVAVGYYFTSYSTDGINWTTSSQGPYGTWYGITYGNGKFVAAGSKPVGGYALMYSADGVDWTGTTITTNRNFSSVAYGDGVFMAVAPTGGGYSYDGITWTNIANGYGTSFWGVSFGGGRFVQVGETGNPGLTAFAILTNTLTYSITSSSFTSQIHLLDNPTSTQTYYGYINYTSSVPTGTQVDFFVRHASATTGNMSAWVATTSYLLLSSTDTAWQYRADLYKATTTMLGPTISDVNLFFRTTGYWESPEVSMGQIGAWGTFLVDTTLTGNATWNYQIYVATFAGGTATATPSTIQPATTIPVSTGTYSKIRAYNSLYSGTETVRINDLSWSWSRTPDKMANAFEYKGDIYFAVPYSNSVSNNRLLKFDLRNVGWTIFDLSVNSPLVIDEYVFFGSPVGGYVYQYPVGGADNGSAINSYWKTKDFVGTNPYVTKQFQKVSLVMGSHYGSSLDVTYEMDTSTNTSYSISLTDTGSSFIRSNRALQIGAIGSFFNLEIGNNAANKPWSFYGANINYVDNPWRVTP